MNWTYYRIEVRRLFRDKAGVFYTTVLPAFLYLVFGADPSYGDESVGSGNVSMLIMISMAAYGAATATTGVGGSTALEQLQGWGRQLGLTPMPDRGYIVVKAASALTMTAMPIALIYTIGAFTGARGPLWVWIAAAVITLIGAMTFALYGIDFGLALRSESAIQVAGGSLVVLGFLGNIFVPLSGAMLVVARFTPLYGYATLAKWPLTEGGEMDGAGGDIIDVPLWQPVTNVVFWTAMLAAASIWLVPRGRVRR